MATKITKTYSIEVQYEYSDEAEITDADAPVAELRTLIKKLILEQCSVQKGILVAKPTASEVTET